MCIVYALKLYEFWDFLSKCMNYLLFLEIVYV